MSACHAALLKAVPSANNLLIVWWSIGDQFASQEASRGTERHRARKGLPVKMMLMGKSAPV